MPRQRRRPRREDSAQGSADAAGLRAILAEKLPQSRAPLSTGVTTDDVAAHGYEMRMKRPSDGMPSAVTANNM